MTINRDPKRPPRPAIKKDVSVVNRAVSGKLKAYYDEIAAEEVPDRFKELLSRLDEQQDD